MERYKKRYIKNAVVIPVAVAIVVSALFFVLIYTNSSDFPSVNERLVLASYDSADISEAAEIEVHNNSVSRSKIDNLQSNMTFGNIRINQTDYPLIYDANEVNAVGKFNMDAGNTFIGDVGTAYVSCYKSDSKALKAVAIGDEIEIETNYGSFVYEVIKTTSADKSTLSHIGDGVGRALVLYTDASQGAGIGSAYFCAVCQFADGTQITQ